MQGVRRFLRRGLRLVPAVLLLSLCSVCVGSAWPLSIAVRAAGPVLQAQLDLASPDSSRARLLVLPAGTRTLEVTGATGEPGAVSVPGASIHVSRVMIMRGTPLATVWLDAPVARTLAAAGVVRVTVRLSARDAHGREIDPVAQAIPAARTLPDANGSTRGGYLIISADAYADALQPLIAWKRACGFDVKLVLTSETGRTLNEIKAFVRNAYDTWDIPPAYLLLAGDVEDIPSGDLIGNVTDHVYACVDGNDFIADINVGRFVAKNAGDIALQVAKTVGYESRPDTSGSAAGDEETWFNRALMVAGNYGSATPIPVCQWIGAELGKVGFAKVSEAYYPPFADGCGPYFCPIGDAIDDGVSIINYRGWSRESPPGWDVPDYTTDDIVTLANGWKLPFVFSIVCHTGDFGRPDEDGFGEVWVKAGTPAAPLGAVGFIGTAEQWSKTRWNDRIDIELFETFCYDGVHEVGPMLNTAKTALLEHFPTEIYLADAIEDEAVEFYTYIYNILADPNLSIWTERPHTLRVTGLPETIAGGTNSLSVHVTLADGTTPVAGAHVACVQDDAVTGYAMSDANGDAIVAITLASEGPVTCTVTGTNLYPWRTEMPVVPAERALTCIGASVSGADALVPGRQASVLIEVRNTGTVDLPGTAASITAPPEVEIIDGTTEFGTIAAGATATALDPVTIVVGQEVENGVRLRFTLTPSMEALATSEFRVTTAAPEFVVEAMTDGGDGVFDAGEECDLVLTVRNVGSVSGGVSIAALETSGTGAGITLIDASGRFEAIEPGATGDNAGNPFRVKLDGTLAAGTVIPLDVVYSSQDGPLGRFSTNLVVGAIDGGAPTGPDAHGYYAYDSADIDYRAQAPACHWIEISTRYDGPGTKLAIDYDNVVPQVVALPFPFTFYGQSYDSVLVSDNGWLAFDTTYFFDTRNWAMPDRWGGCCQVAAFWDNLNPDRTVPGTDGIYAWNDAVNHRFVVEWNRLRNVEESATHLQSFEIVLYDPAYYPTRTGDGEIVFQYKQVVNDDYKTMYSTVGIEDQTETVGLQYSYSNQYAPGAVPLAPGLAIRLTTDSPVYNPIVLRDFAASWAPGGMRPAAASSPAGSDVPGSVLVRWDCDGDPAIAGFELLRASATSPDGASGTGAGVGGAGWSEAEVIHAGWIPAHSRCYTDSTADPGACYLYRLRAVGTVGAGRTLGETVYAGLPTNGPALCLMSPNPSPAGAVLLMRPGKGANGEVIVLDAAGRRVRTLAGDASGGAATRVVTWDGRDAFGRLVPSGTYWLRPASGSEQRAVRVMVVR